MFLGCSRIIALGTLVLAAGGMTITDSVYGEPNKLEKATAAKVLIGEAIQSASEKVSGTVIEAKLEQKHDRLMWAVDIVTPEKKIMEVHIDAETGSVIDVAEENAKMKKVKRNDAHHKQP